jgi:hypothetical protein
LQISTQGRQRPTDASCRDRPYILVVLLQNTPGDSWKQN